MRDIRTSEGAPGERSIRNISVGARKHTRPSVTADHSHELPPDGPATLPHRRSRRRQRRFWLLALIVIGVCAALGILLSTVFSGATVTVTPRTEAVTLPASIIAMQNAPVGTLAYQTLSVTRSSSLSVPAQGTQKVSRSASGVITISNSYSSASQRLIANTRFEAPDGKIYRVRDSVTVPGTTGTGSAMKPGVVTATVYADSPGPDYNKPAGTVFTIPGFKGDPRYAKFSGKAGAAITGGFVGDEPSVSASDLAAAKTSLQQKLDTAVRAAAAAELPEGSIAIPGTLEITFADLVQTAGQNKTATLTQNATGSGLMVRQGDLAAAIARQTVEGYKGEALQFGADSSVDASVASTSKRAEGTVSILLKGQATLVWQFDMAALTQALLSKSKTEFQTVISSFAPAIAKADASIRPFWRGAFPGDVTKIQVKIAE